LRFEAGNPRPVRRFHLPHMDLRVNDQALVRWSMPDRRRACC
jgi:hypothetical protein